MGEELDASAVTEQGLLGDRAYALVDAETGKVASAKNPKRWPKLFQCSATLTEPPETVRELSLRGRLRRGVSRRGGALWGSGGAGKMTQRPPDERHLVGAGSRR